MKGMSSSDDEIKSRIEYLCTLSLIMTMFRVTAQDLKYGNVKTKKEAKKFLESDWFNEICVNMGLGTERVKKLIITSKRTGSRTSYE
jgi:hypothetical protein